MKGFMRAFAYGLGAILFVYFIAYLGSLGK